MNEQHIELYEYAREVKNKSDSLAADGWRIQHLLERRDYIIVVYTRPGR